MTDAANGANMRKLIDADLQDTLDEEIEMELDDHRLQTLKMAPRTPATPTTGSTASITSRSCSACKANS